MGRARMPLRLLIVEDIQFTLRQLVSLFRGSFPDAAIETAVTTTEALRKIREAQRSGKEYDVAVLDFMLPHDPGGHLQVDDAICKEVHSSMPNAMVAHITGYRDCPEVTQHVYSEDMRDSARAKVVLLSKLDHRWAQDLLCEVKRFVYGNRIRRMLDTLFGRRDNRHARTPRSELHSPRGRRSVTHDLAALTREIALRWADLDERLQEHIRGIFKVDTSGDGIRVTLL